MKTNTAVRLVENNAMSSTAFTIQASGKMFHMVISGLYSNKAQSITRELWSNAFDAHSMVGKEDVPFEVTFPTAMTPVFSVRDFGPGIAHDDMEGFYTVLGHSTKENTNKAVGKWGVGRMSPMSYTDTFSVVSRHKGMVAYYSVQLGPDGAPQLHVLAPPSPTTEADGLEVSFPVKRVRKDWLDIYSATIKNEIGTTVKMDRAQVDDDPKRTCSSGLHVCADEYLKGYHGGDGYRTLVVEVSPADVVAVPYDYNFSKMRVCEYTVLAEISEEQIPETLSNKVYDTKQQQGRDPKTGRFLKK